MCVFKLSSLFQVLRFQWQLLIIIWVSAPLHSTLTQRKTTSFSAWLPDMFYHSFYTLISIYFELDCYVCIIGFVLHIMLLNNSVCYCEVSIFECFSKYSYVSVQMCKPYPADVLLSLNLCLPIEVFYHHNQSALFTFRFVSLLLLMMM